MVELGISTIAETRERTKRCRKCGRPLEAWNTFGGKLMNEEVCEECLVAGNGVIHVLNILGYTFDKDIYAAAWERFRNDTRSMEKVEKGAHEDALKCNIIVKYMVEVDQKERLERGKRNMEKLESGELQEELL